MSSVGSLNTPPLLLEPESSFGKRAILPTLLVKRQMIWCSLFLITTLAATRKCSPFQLSKVENLKLKSLLVQTTLPLSSFTCQLMAAAFREPPLISWDKTLPKCLMLHSRMRINKSSTYGKPLGVSRLAQSAQ